MSTTATPPPPPPPPAGAQPPPPGPASGPSAAPRAGGTWTLTWAGVWTIAQLELRQRIRSTRWIVALVVFGVVVGGVTALTWAVAGGLRGEIGSDADTGRAMFGFIVFFVLFLGLLVSPTLSATSINGDRAGGTLATLQVTLLSPAEIVLGKLLAAWLASLAFLAVSVPFVLWAFATGGTPPLALLTTLLLLAVILAVVCAIGLGWSALSARTSGSAVLTYVTIASLTILSLIVFGLSLQLVSADERVQVYGVDWRSYDGFEEPEECTTFEEERWVAHTERTWWLLAINPFVVVADAMPLDADVSVGDPMSGIKLGVRSAREGASQPLDECWIDDDGGSMGWMQDPDDQAPVWPWGLGANLLLGAAGVWVAVRRLRIPQRTLAKGSRVA